MGGSTESAYLQEKITLLKNLLHHLLEKMDEGVLYLNAEGIILSFNKKAEELLSFSANDLLLTPFHNHFHDLAFGFSMQDALHFGLKETLFYVTHGKRPLEVKVYLEKGIFLFLRDLSLIDNLKKELAHQERLKELGQLSSIVTHEIKNPLGGIRGYAMLLERALSDPYLLEMATKIKEGTLSLERLLNKILTFAKPVPLQIKTIDLAQILRKEIKLMKMDPVHKNVQVELHISEEPFYLPIDEEAIKQALLNLILNAFQAMPKGGKVVISLMKEFTSAHLSISDTGSGIDQEDLPHIFSPFFTTKEKGHGLGLTETEKIIKAHFGNIQVRSEKNHGTTFTLTLPLKRGASS